MSVTTSTRDQVVAEIAAAMNASPPTLAPKVLPQAIYDVRFRLRDLTGGRVVVCPSGKRCEPLTRGGARDREVLIDVAVQYKFASEPPSAAELDPYLALAEAIADHFERRQLDNGAVCLKAEHPALFFQPHMEADRVFTSVVTLTFNINQ